MEYLNNLYSLNPNIKFVDLESREITDLTPLLPALARFNSLEELDLSSNFLTSLPSQLSSLKHLKTLNLTKNQLHSLAAATSSLKTLPKLRKLSINLEDRESVVLVLESLPKLKVLNDQSINLEGNSADDKDNADSDIDASSLADFKQEQEVLHAVKTATFFKSKLKGKMIEELSKSFTEVVNGYLNREVEPNEDEIKAGIEKLKTKYTLLDHCTRYLLETQSNQEFKNLWENILNRNGMLIASLCELAIRGKEENIYKRELNKLKGEVGTLGEKNEKLAEEVKEHIKDKNEMMRNFIEEKKHLDNKHAKEKKELTQKLIRLRNEMAKRPVNREDDAIHERMTPRNRQPKKSESKGHSDMKRSASKSPSNNQQDTPPQRPPQRANEPSNAEHKSAEEERAVSAHEERESRQNVESFSECSKRQVKFESSKSLSLRQMKELIGDVYEQKKKHDQKCLQGGMPKETMEQYVYTYLNQQYGLRNLILDWTKAILEGIAKYSPIDSEVLLFERILRNECEEGFNYVLVRAKNDIIETIKKHIRNKRKFITEKELKATVDKITHNPISEDVWSEIINTLCSPADRSILHAKILENSQQEADRKGKAQRILFEDLQNIFLEYVLAVHEINISKFVKTFKAVDKEKRGALNQDEFAELLEKLKIEITPIYFEKLLEMLDPNKNQSITFSDCLSAFETEQVTIAGEGDTDGTSKKKYTLLEVMNMNQSCLYFTL
eukprot:TRINITY_DN6712_c0_g1_i6.p1 TRINITY_DN6712_c0_g1~~TRINITY_DN6712_c0_g1_i6.p1  ORF type:complete len:726 (+),score=212.97 TRINITY_DN6712_c0_g1_i6:142-2319(+)